MENTDDEMFADSQDIRASNEELNAIGILADQLVAMENEIEELELQISEIKKRKSQLETETLPGVMDSAGLSEFKTVEGHKLSIKDIISCNPPKDRKEEVYGYLRENEGDGLIKNEVSIPFGRDQDAAAKELISKIKELGYDASLESSVHSSSLNAWAKEQVQAGKALDADLLGLYVGRVAKVKLKKEKMQ